MPEMWAAVLVAQSLGDPSGWGIIQAYGVAAPFAFLLLAVVTVQHKQLNARDTKIDALRTEMQSKLESKDTQMLALVERVLPLTVETTAALGESSSAFKEMAERTLSRDELYRLRDLIDRAERRGT